MQSLLPPVVHHLRRLTVAALVGLMISAGQLAAQPPADQPDNDDRDRFTYLNAVRFGQTQAEIVDTAKMEAVKRIYEPWRNRTGQPIDPAVMKQMYQAGGFKVVKTLIENKTIAPEHSLDMADQRIIMILDVLSKVCQENGWKIYRSDSGNQSAGMKSDVDQTIYVYKLDEQGQWVRSEADDAKLVAEFSRRFPGETGLSLDALDIATIAGKDKFPDPRRTSVQLDAEGLRPFQLHAKETMAALRATPDAYTYCGAVVQQMQLRALEAIEKQLRVDPTQPGGESTARASRIPELAGRLGPNGLNNLVLMELGPTADDPNWKPREVSRERAIDVMFDSLKPELIKGHAYDAAVANYLEFMHHLKDKHPAAKYHLRALDNGVQILRQLDGKTARVEYESLKSDAARMAHLEALVGKNPGTRHLLKNWKAALDVSVALRQAHKKGNLTDEDYKQALRPIAEELAGSDWEKHIDKARREYDRRCQEFMLHNIIVTSTDRVLDWVTFDPNDPAKRPDMFRSVDELRLRRAIGLSGKQHDAAWDKVKGDIFKNHSDIARLQLLFSFHEMRPDVVQRIVELAKLRGVRGPQLERLNGLVAESQAKLFGVWRFAEYPKLYAQYYSQIAQHRIGEYTKGIKHYILIQAGVIDTDAGRQPKVLGYDDPLFRLIQRSKTGSILSRYARNAIFDVGNIDGAVQVLRVWSESGGDPDAIREAVIRESISALPLIGQVYIVAQSGSAADAAYTGTIMIVCMVVPQAGIAAMLFSLGDAGVSLYEHEVSKPLNDTIADAIYHGYVGPSLYSFEQTPPAFTSEDAAALKAAQAAAERLKNATGEEEQGELSRHLAVAKKLHHKQVNWDAHEAEKRKRQTYEGSALLGTGAQLKQRKLDGPTLLEDVEPMIFYAPSVDGPVDFTIKPLDPTQRQRLDELKQIVEPELNRAENEPNTIDPVTLEGLKFELAGLESHHNAHQRAQRYLNSALTKLELQHRIHRDSLFPWLAKRNRSRDMVDARAYVKTWCENHRGSVTDALKKLDVTDDDEIPEAAVEELGLRLLEDLERSKQLWLHHEFVQKEQQKQDAARMERSQGAMAGQALLNGAFSPPEGLLSAETRALLEAAGLDVSSVLSLLPTAEAIHERHVPDAPPEIEVSFRKVRIGEGTEDEPAEYEFRPDVKVTANPEIYQPPYSFKTFLLDPPAAKQAAAARGFQGLPLGDDTVRSLTEYAQKAQRAVDAAATAENASKDTPLSPVVLTFVFCSNQAIPERVVPETAALLPRLEKFPIPGEQEQGYLFGSTALIPAGPASPVEILASGTTRYNAANHGYTDAMGGNGTYADVWPGTWVRFRVRDTDKLQPSEGLEALIGGSGTAQQYSALAFQRQIADSPDGPWQNIGPEVTVSARGEKEQPKEGEHPRLKTSWHLWKDPANDDEFVTWGGGTVEVPESQQPKGVGGLIRGLGGESGWDANENYRGAYFRMVQAAQGTSMDADKLTGLISTLRQAGYSPQDIAKDLGIPLETVQKHAGPAPSRQLSDAEKKQAAEAAMLALLGGMKTIEQKTFSDPVAPEFDIFPFGVPGTQTELQSAWFVIGGSNHGSMEPFHKFTVTCMGLRRHFWSDQVGICRTRLPAVRAGRAEELTVETEFRGKNYSRTFTLLGKRLLEQDLLSQIDAENNYRYRALKLKALVAKEAPAVGGTLAPLRVLQKETGDLWAAWMKSKDPEVDKRYEQKKEQLSKLQRQVDEYQEKLQNEVDDLRNQANQLADQVRQSKEENDPAKSRLRGLADTYQTKSDKQMQFRLQLELLRIAGDRDEDVRRQQGNGTSAEVRAREIRDAAASRASDILHAFQEAADSALATNRWRELEDLLKGWQRALDQAKSMDKTFLIDLTRCAEAYAGMLWTWACAVGDSAELNKAIQLLQQQRKENGSWDHEPWVKGIAKPLEINEWQMLARVTAETTGDGQQAAEYWLQAEKIEKELGEPVERPELTTRLLYPEQHHNRVPVEKLEAYRPGWWPNKS